MSKPSALVLIFSEVTFWASPMIRACRLCFSTALALIHGRWGWRAGIAGGDTRH